MNKRDIKPFGLRLKESLKEDLRHEAERNRHSMNTEAEMLIEDGFRWREMKRKQAVA